MKTFALIIFFINLSIIAKGQNPEVDSEEPKESKWFVKIYGRYGFPTSGSYKPTVDIPTKIPFSTSSNVKGFDSTFNYTNKRKGFGKGVKAGVGIGYILNDIVNLGMDLDQYWSGTLSTEFSYVNTSKNPVITDIKTHSVKSNMLTLTPNVTFKAINNPNYYFYLRLGLSLGLLKKLNEDFDYTRSSNDTIKKIITTTRTLEEYSYKGGVPIGYLASVGVQAKVSSKIRVFAEFDANFISYAPSKRSMTAYASLRNNAPVPGDTFENRPKSQKETEYSNKSLDYTGFRNSFQSSKRPKIKFPYSSIGINIGLAFRL